jgi:DNA-binding beta-propeller fold protein YncE
MMFPAFMIPVGVVISLDGSTAYVADRGTAEVYVIDIATASVIGLVSNPLVMDPFTQSLYLAISSDGTFSYLTDFFGAKVFKINMTTMPFPSASAVVTNGIGPAFVMTTACAVTPDMGFVYVSDYMTNHVYKINTMTNAVTNAITDMGFSGLTGVTVIPDGSLAYVCSNAGGGVFSIDTMTNMVFPVTTTGFSAFINPAIVASSPASAPPPSGLQPPRNLNGSQTRNDFGVVFSLSATLTWAESLSAGVAGYNIYRDGVKIGSVGSSVFQYIDNNAPKGTKGYEVTAFNASGSESAPVDVQVK